jgi:hypothetical protein
MASYYLGGNEIGVEAETRLFPTFSAGIDKSDSHVEGGILPNINGSLFHTTHTDVL